MKSLTVVAVCLLLVSVTGAFAQTAPNVTTPTEGALLGPNYDVLGSMPAKAFLVVMTDVVNLSTGEVLRSVPGIRHWTEADGTFHYRVASPRVSIGEKDTELSYRVRVFEASPDGTTGPETVINCGMVK